jgi:predicted small metal-binding protein
VDDLAGGRMARHARELDPLHVAHHGDPGHRPPTMPAVVRNNPRATSPTEEEAGMPVINCQCGETVRGNDDEELVANAEAHIREAHPDMVGTMSRDDLLAMKEDG